LLDDGLRRHPRAGIAGTAPRERRPPVSRAQGDDARLGKASLSMAGWTLVSRVSGFARAATAAAVLGPTYLGNTYLALNLVPNLAFELLTGSLFATLLVPSLVRALGSADERAAERVAGGFLGVVAIGGAAVALVAMLAGRLILGVLTAPVGDPAVADDQRRVGLLLLALMMPQVVLYGAAATGAAVMNAHGRFALAAAAPVAENVGIIATLCASAIVFGIGRPLGEVTTGEVLLLGLGTTGSVALHAGVQCWGAHRAGTTLIPRAGWRDPDVVRVLRLMVPSFAYSGLNAVRLYAPIVVANAVAGGVVAFVLALQFMRFPIAIGAGSVATIFLPRLSRLYHERAMTLFRAEYTRAVRLVLFVTIPAAAGYLVLATPLAEAVAVGAMGTREGVDLLALSLAAVAPGVVGESQFNLATYASYALDDARSPLRSMAVRTGVTLGGTAIALIVTGGTAVVLILGLAVSVANVTGAWHLARRLRAGVPGERRLAAGFVMRLVAVSAVATGAAYMAAVLVSGWTTDAIAVLAAVAVAVAVFVAVERRLGSPELDFFVAGLPRRAARR
jgi:putative peptidoglycan lipid II flippase